MSTKANKLPLDAPVTGHFIAEMHTALPIGQDANAALGKAEQQQGAEVEEISAVHDRSHEADYSVAFIRQHFGQDVASLCGCLNSLLAGSPLAGGYLPLQEDSVFSRLQDGVLLCAAVNAISVGALDETQVFHGDQLADSERGELRAHQNVNLALRSLELVGVVTRSYIAATLCGGSAVPFVGILVQIVLAASLSWLGPEGNRSLLLYTMDNWDSPEAEEQLKGLTQEELLKHWVNYQLRKTPPPPPPPPPNAVSRSPRAQSPKAAAEPPSVLDEIRGFKKGQLKPAVATAWTPPPPEPGSLDEKLRAALKKINAATEGSEDDEEDDS